MLFVELFNQILRDLMMSCTQTTETLSIPTEHETLTDLSRSQHLHLLQTSLTLFLSYKTSV